MLRTKLNKPPVSIEHVYSDLLIDLLENNLYKPLTLVSAPPPYGKSISISSWIERIDCRYGWTSLNSDHNDFLNILSYLYTRLKKLNAKLLTIWLEFISAFEVIIENYYHVNMKIHPCNELRKCQK